jgi:hypothetical protein
MRRRRIVIGSALPIAWDSRVRLGLVALAVTFQGFAACASQDLRPHERLDPRTAIHATILAEPWVYAREVPMLAAHARDYLNIGVVETNRAGERAYWLGVVAWSTIDRRVPTERNESPGRIRLQHAKGPIELAPEAGSRAQVGLDAPVFAGPAESFSESWYSLSAEQVRQLGEAPPQGAELLGADGQPIQYEEWHARKKPMVEFLKAVGL